MGLDHFLQEIPPEGEGIDFLNQVEQDPSQGGTYVQRASTGRRREYPGGDSDGDGYGRLHRDQRPPDRGGYPGGTPPDRGGYPGGRPPGRGRGPRGYLNETGRSPGRGGYPGEGPPGGQVPPGPQGPPGPVRPIIVQPPQVTLDTTALESTLDTVGQSMMQLARAQDQTNRQLQQHIQQGQANMQADTGALQELATSTYQRNFNHIFASIPIYDGSDREGFFPQLEHLEAACFYRGRNIKTKALGRSAGPVQNVIMALPNARY